MIYVQQEFFSLETSWAGHFFLHNVLQDFFSSKKVSPSFCKNAFTFTV